MALQGGNTVATGLHMEGEMKREVVQCPSAACAVVTQGSEVQCSMCEGLGTTDSLQ